MKQDLKILQTAIRFWLIDNQLITLDVNPYMCKILGGKRRDYRHNILNLLMRKANYIKKQ